MSSRFPCVTPVVENLSPDFLRAITNYCEGTLNVGASRLLKCSMYKLVQGSMSVSKEGGKSINQIYSCGMSLVLILKLLLYQKQINLY